MVLVGNLEIGIKTKGVKALSEGHSLFSSKHVHDVAYHSISHFLGYYYFITFLHVACYWLFVCLFACLFCSQYS